MRKMTLHAFKAVKSLRDVLGEVKQLLESPNGAKLSASQKLLEALKDSFS